MTDPTVYCNAEIRVLIRRTLRSDAGRTPPAASAAACALAVWLLVDDDEDVVVNRRDGSGAS